MGPDPERRTCRVLRFSVLGLYLEGTVGKALKLVVAKEDRVGGGEAEKEPRREVSDLAFGMPVGAHLNYMPQGPDVTREHHRCLGLVGQHRACRLLHFFARVGLVLRVEQGGTALLALQQAVRHRFILGGGSVGPLLEEGVQLRVVLVLGALHKTQHAPRNVALGDLADAHSGPVPYQLVSDAPADAVEQETEVSVLQHTTMPSGGKALEVRGGVLVGGASGTKGRVA